MINFACRHYKASKPCVFNKTEGSECPSCTHVSEFRDRILIVKLDAIGDVLRSASLLPAIISQRQTPYIAWITKPDSVELVKMMKYVDEVIELSDLGLLRVMTGGWDYVYSLSNDIPSASIATAAHAKNPPVGYALQNGVITPSNEAAANWLRMAAFDRLKQENTRSYQSLMLEIVGQDKSALVPPALDVPEGLQKKAHARISALFSGSSRPRIAVNVGSGARWPKKMLDVEQTYALLRRLHEKADVDIVLVGGAAESEKTDAIIAMCGGDPRIKPALTPTSIPEFVAMLMQTDALFCGDTLALHIATAIRLPTVAVFGPTSSAEIPDFKGLIAKTWATELDCLGCYGDCSKARHCMALLEIDRLADMILAQLDKFGPRTDRR